MWLPTLSDAVEKVVTPAVKVPVPMAVVPSENVTVPVGVAVPVVSATVAVKLMVVPEVPLVGEAASWVEVGARVGVLAMVRLSAVETEAA